MGFIEYSDIGFRAFVFSSRQQEIIQRKQSIIQSVYSNYNLTPKSVLFVGFNPAIVNCTTATIYITEVSQEVQDWLAANGISAEFIAAEDLFNYGRNFDAVLALEEYFTFAENEEQQKSQFDMICKVARQCVITTLRDYKNQEFKDREFSMPAVIKTDAGSRVFLEYHDYDMADRNVWARTVYEITNAELQVNGPFHCRHMFFKQCAKFGYDAGAKEFLVHKNLMYKSLIKKNYEHVISIKF
jgi:hypothetical protein